MLSTCRRPLLILLATILLAVAAQADRAADLNTLFAAAYPADGPGATVLVVQDGTTLLRAGYGLADLERQVANEPDMVFRLGSITKQFTAVGIMMLMEDGKLALDDPIEKHLTDYPAPEQVVTIEHLLTHTSGIMSYTDIPEFMEDAHNDRTVGEVIDVFKDFDLLFEPGAEWRYSNSGYFLLGAIIEAVAGMPYEEFIQTRIFDPLGMTASYYGSFERIIPRRALGYHRDGGTPVNAPYISMTRPYAAGSLLSTVDDLWRWTEAMEADELVTRESRERMWTPAVLNDGEETRYGYGWMLGEYEGDAVVMHGGGIHGFSTFSLTIPARKTFVAVLSNDPQHDQNPQMLGQKAVALASGEALPVADPNLDPAIFDRYVGVYRINDDETRVVTVEDGILYTRRTGGGKQPTGAISATEFFYPHSYSRLRFELDDHGQVVRMHVKNWGGREEPAELTDEPVPTGPVVADVDPAIYDHYVGVYELMPGFELAITRDGDRLMGQATGQPQVEVFPSSETEYFLKVVDATLEFIVDEATGDATQLILKQGGAVMTGERVK